MITEAKDLLEAVLAAHPAPGLVLTKRVRGAAEERAAVNNRELPFAALISMPGSFDGKTSRRAARPVEGGGIERYYIRGTRTVPIQIRIWTRTEDEADKIVSAFLPYIPHRWECGLDSGLVEIQRTEASDFASLVSGHYAMAVVVAFSLDASTPGERPN